MDGSWSFFLSPESAVWGALGNFEERYPGRVWDCWLVDDWGNYFDWDCGDSYIEVVFQDSFAVRIVEIAEIRLY
jgi:hypothetical protein